MVWTMVYYRRLGVMDAATRRLETVFMPWSSSARGDANLTKAYDRLAFLQQACNESTKLNMEMRRDFYGTRTAAEAKFASNERIIEEHLAAVDARFASTETSIEQ